MSPDKRILQNELYVSVTEAAGCFQIETIEIQRFVQAELIEPPREIAGEPCLPARDLDRVAAILRHTRLLGLDADALRVLVRSGTLAL